MVRTGSQLENLFMKELIDEPTSVEDISSKLSDLTSHVDDFLRQYEVLSLELTISKNCNCLLGERIVQLERKNFLSCYTNTDSSITHTLWKDLENDHNS